MTLTFSLFLNTMHGRLQCRLKKSNEMRFNRKVTIENFHVEVEQEKCDALKLQSTKSKVI